MAYIPLRSIKFLIFAFLRAASFAFTAACSACSARSATNCAAPCPPPRARPPMPDAETLILLMLVLPYAFYVIWLCVRRER